MSCRSFASEVLCPHLYCGTNHINLLGFWWVLSETHISLYCDSSEIIYPIIYLSTRLSLSLYIYVCVCVCVFSHSVVSDSFVTPWTVARQAFLSMGILQAKNTEVNCHTLLQEIFLT